MHCNLVIENICVGGKVYKDEFKGLLQIEGFYFCRALNQQELDEALGDDLHPLAVAVSTDGRRGLTLALQSSYYDPGDDDNCDILGYVDLDLHQARILHAALGAALAMHQTQGNGDNA